MLKFLPKKKTGARGRSRATDNLPRLPYIPLDSSDDLVGPTCHTHSSSPPLGSTPHSPVSALPPPPPRAAIAAVSSEPPTNRALPDRPSLPPGARTVPGFPLRARLRTPPERGEAIWPRRRRAHPPPTRGIPDPTAPPPPSYPHFASVLPAGFDWRSPTTRV
jgi:hypothetical protein